MLRQWRRNYLFLIPLCLIAASYQLAYTVLAFTNLIHWDRVASAPFQVDDFAHVRVISAPAKMAGLKQDDYVARVDGRDLTADRVLWEEIHRHRPGDTLLVEVVHKGGTAARQLTISLSTSRKEAPTVGTWLLVAMLVLVPLFCLAAGIYVVLRRPDDVRAIVVFGLLVSVSQMVNTVDISSSPGGLWEFALGYSSLGTSAWPIWMALFGLYFPTRFDWDKKRPTLKWLLIGPLLALPAISIFDVEGALNNFRLVTPLESLLQKIHFEAIALVLTTISITVFFWALGVKTATLTNRDAKRRLQLLRWGSAGALGPIGIFVFYQLFSGDRQAKNIPEWAIIAVCVIFFIFPITLVYVVVAERAMNVGMVVRQSMRYTLAKGGMRVALAIIATSFMFGLVVLVFGRIMSEATRIAVTATAAFIMVFAVRFARKHLIAWVDRKFFRDTYNSEQILEELSDTVRTVVDEKILFDTVSRRISESMHVENVAVLLSSNGAFHPVYWLGLNLTDRLTLEASSATIDQIRNSKEPPRVYFDDEKNWVYQTSNEEVATLRLLNSQLLLPVGLKDRLLGILSLGPKRSEEPFSRTDVQLLRSVALQTGLALENSRLMTTVASEMAQRLKLNREIEIAREVQERLFPQMLVTMPGLDYLGACRPALGVGGDYYDFIALPNGDLGVAIGDVSGKGIAAALLMASLQASLRGQTIQAGADLAVVLTNVNRLIYEATPDNRYATFFYGQYHRGSCLFTYVNAGHNPPVILRRQSGGTVAIRLETGGPVVGLFSNAQYQQATVPFEPGDVFVGFTDGISEAMNRQDEEWGEENLIPAIMECADKPAVEIIPALMQAADQFADGAPQHDDMTVVVVKVLHHEQEKALIV
jgi:sigma-B regulation protein RsbU (phosphoserine phosphatase)